MDQKDFKTPTELHDYAERTGNVYPREKECSPLQRQPVLSPEQ